MSVSVCVCVRYMSSNKKLFLDYKKCYKINSHIEMCDFVVAAAVVVISIFRSY